ncbi:2-hydroxymuconate tautomerase [Geodermatophilus sp. DSM 45219]|uniref:2-hydroxymuconate tautomerase n=1 Tax=Geodermatophilus sp. DSM 45219 TaxID=1881103 RepID=UPI000880330B|nr:2-hydroxymuconate tautomerase [Geodermatophilus sp. DSM 45219]SDN70751.1 4-oxalocrotonate tautomerase [Geodermatophilus sp. DSM 45219]
MPLVEVTLGAGRTDQQVRELIHEVHAAVTRTTGARSEHVRVIVREVPRAHWATGDVTLSEMDAAAPPSAPSTTTTTTVSQEPT